MGQGQFRSIETQGCTSGKTVIIVNKDHKIFVALSESLYWRQAYFKVFDGPSIERAIMMGQGNIRSDSRQHLHYGH